MRLRAFFLFYIMVGAVGISKSQNINTATNGLYKPSGSSVGLGGTLNTNTTIDLGASYFFKLSKSSQDYITVLNGGNVGIGTSNPAYALDVNGAVRVGSLASDPTGAAGVVYYNSSLNKLKAYVNGGWKNVLMEGDVSGSSLPANQIAYGDGNGITSSSNFTYNGSAFKIAYPSANTSQANHLLTLEAPTGSNQMSLGFTFNNIPKASLRVNDIGQYVLSSVGDQFIGHSEYSATSNIYFGSYNGSGYGVFYDGTNRRLGINTAGYGSVAYTLDVNGAVRIGDLTVMTSPGDQDYITSQRALSYTSTEHRFRTGSVMPLSINAAGSFFDKGLVVPVSATNTLDAYGAIYSNSNDRYFYGRVNGGYKKFLMDGDAVTTGSNDFIQNQNSVLQNANFKISGGASVNQLNANGIHIGNNADGWWGENNQLLGNTAFGKSHVGGAPNEGYLIGVGGDNGTGNFKALRLHINTTGFPGTEGTGPVLEFSGRKHGNGSTGFGQILGYSTNIVHGGAMNFYTNREYGAYGVMELAMTLNDQQEVVVNNLLKLGNKNADPTGANGALFYNSATNKFRGYQNGAWKNFLVEGDVVEGSVSLPSNQIAFGTGSTITSNSNLTYDGSTFAINASSIASVNYSQYKLAVNGNAIFTRVKVRESNVWPDYVFENTYKLPTLKEVEAFIKKHKHLPEVPSAAEVKKEGLDIGDNQAMLLKKIEELTLYVIEQNKKIEELQEKVEKLSRK